MALECVPSERQRLLGVSRGDSKLKLRGTGASAARVALFAALPCTVGTKGQLPDQTSRRKP